MDEFIPDHALSRIAPINQFAHRRYREAKLALVTLYLDLNKMEKMFKYIINRLHRLLAAEPELTNRFAFTVLDHKKFGDSLPTEFGVPAIDFAVTVANLTTLQLWGIDVRRLQIICTYVCCFCST